MAVLRDVVEPKTGTRNPAIAPEDPFTYVDVSAIDNEEKVIVGARVLLGGQAPSRARKLIRKDDVLVSTVRPNLNAVAVVPAHLDGQVASTGFCVLRAKECVIPEFLYFYVRSKAFVDGLCQLVAGAMYPAVTDSQVLDLPLPLPSLPEQHRIVDLLARAEGIVRLRREAQQKVPSCSRRSSSTCSATRRRTRKGGLSGHSAICLRCRCGTEYLPRGLGGIPRASLPFPQ